MNQQHTPGPWRVSESDTVVGPSGNVVAECCGYSVQATDAAQRKQGGREANARLIAAAPDLLAALRSLFENCAMIHSQWGDNDNKKEADAAIASARAAIAKAEGREG